MAATKAKPVQVYLDTSAYSVLADQRRDTREIHRELVKVRDSQHCEFRYSYVHILENVSIATGAASRKLSKARLAVMRDLCGTMCLRPNDQIEDREFIEAVTGRSLGDESYPYSDAAEWLSGGYGFIDKHAAAVVSDLRRTAARAKEQGKRDPKVLETARKLMLQDALNRYQSQLPLSTTARNALLSCPAGLLTPMRITKALRDVFSDLETVADWASDTPQGEHFSRLLRERAMIVIAHIAEGRELADQLLSSGIQVRGARITLANLVKAGMQDAPREFIATHLEQLFVRNESSLGTNGIGRDSWRPETVDLQRIPYLTNLIAVTGQNTKSTLLTDRSLDAAQSDTGTGCTHSICLTWTCSTLIGTPRILLRMQPSRSPGGLSLSSTKYHCYPRSCGPAQGVTSPAKVDYCRCIIPTVSTV